MCLNKKNYYFSIFLLSGVARVPCAPGQKYFCPPLKNAVFEVKSKRKSVKEAKAEGLIIGTHLFVKEPRPGDSKVTFSIFESSCHLLLPV